MDEQRLSISEVARQLAVAPKTLVRWEKSGKVKKAKRDWRGWRVYTVADIVSLKNFKEAIYGED
ncbi:MAG: helix-turn-helix domain-containing protein [Candidatus Omnitrophica bacterium]|nr:helix-turn-helix domain-containing protein [Candidatus Omnitrophota bacterium]